MVACLPIFLSCESLNSLPMENAIKPSARSAIKPKSSICSEAIPIPGMSNAPSTNGPIKTPAIRYAVTAGSFTSLASLDKSRPASRAIDKLKKTLAVCVMEKYAFFQMFFDYARLETFRCERTICSHGILMVDLFSSAIYYTILIRKNLHFFKNIIRQAFTKK